MAKGKERKIELTAYDDLFQTDESREEAKQSRIQDIPLSEIDEFPDHPFTVLDDDDMAQLVESIQRNGVMTPAMVRRKEDGRYELISGHRRCRACALAGLTTLKCEVRELTRADHPEMRSAGTDARRSRDYHGGEQFAAVGDFTQREGVCLQNAAGGDEATGRALPAVSRQPDGQFLPEVHRWKE